MAAATYFIQDTLGKRYAEAVPDFENIAMEANCRTPIICLLSLGSDPSAVIENLAKKRKTV